MIKKFSDFRTEAKDSGEYDNEGGMAKTQLRGVIADADHMIKMFGDDDNLQSGYKTRSLRQPII